MNRQNFVHFTVDELFYLHSMEVLEPERKIEAFEEILEKYHKERSFNFYEKFIKKCYNSVYTLGKSKILLQNKLKTAGNHLDVIVRFEKKSDVAIPTEHSKFFFAFVKEFVAALEEAIRMNRIENNVGLEYLAAYYEDLKFVIQKQGTNNADVLTTLDNEILKVKKSNPLFLPGGEVQTLLPGGGEERLSLTLPLSKINKTTFMDMIKNLHAYNEDDFYKLVEHGFNKYEDDPFRDDAVGYLPLIVTAMKKPSKKLNKFAMQKYLILFIQNQIRRGKSSNFYPLPISTLDEFYVELKKWLDEEREKQTLTDEQHLFIKYGFLLYARKLSPFLEEEYLSVCTIFLTTLCNKLKTKGTNSFKAVLDAEIHFEKEDQLFFMIGYRDLVGFDLVVENGTFVGQYLNDSTLGQYRAPTRDIELAKPDLVISEARLVSYIVSEFFAPMSEYYTIERNTKEENWDVCFKQEYPFAAELEELIRKVQIPYLTVNLDEVSVMSRKHPVHSWKERKTGYFESIIESRFKYELVTDKELHLLFGADSYIGWFHFALIPVETLIKYVKRAIEIGAINLKEEKEFAKCFQIQFRESAEGYAFMRELCYQLHPEVCDAIESFMSRDLMPVSVRDKAVIDFFSESLFLKGHKVRNYLF